MREMTLSLLQVRSPLTLYVLPVAVQAVQVNSFLKTIKFLHMSHVLSLHLLTLDGDSVTVQRYIYIYIYMYVCKENKLFCLHYTPGE